MLIVEISTPLRWSFFWVVQSQVAGGIDFNETPGTKIQLDLVPGVSLEAVSPAS